jgi:O-antigen/teichoic acid export membrane protein
MTNLEETTETLQKQNDSVKSQNAAGDLSVFASGAFTQLFGKVIGRGLFAASQVLLARLLGPTSFGIYGLTWTFFRVLATFSPLGMDKGVIRYGVPALQQGYPQYKGVVKQAVRLATISGLVIGSILFFLTPQIVDFYQLQELAIPLRIVATALPFFAMMMVLLATTRVSKNMRPSIVVEELIQPSAFLLIFIILFFLGLRVNAGTAAVAISYGIAAFVAGIFVIRQFSGLMSVKIIPTISTKSLLRFSFPTALAGIFTLVTLWTDRFFIGYFLPAADLGIYQAVTQAIGLFAITLRAANTAFTPLIADLFAQNEHERLLELYRISTKWLVYINLPLLISLFFAAESFIVVLFGNEYRAGALPLQILLFSQLVYVSTGTVGFLLVMTGNENSWFQYSGFSFFLNICLNWLLVPRLGLVGAAISSVSAISFLYIWGLYNVRRKLSLWPYDRRYLKGLLAAGITIPSVVSIQFLQLDDFIHLSLTGITAVLIFGGVLLLLGIDEEDKFLLQSIRKRIKLSSKKPY